MSARKNPPAAGNHQGAEDQLSGGSASTVARAAVIAHCRAYVARGCFGRYWVLVIDTCPHCAEQHTHGGGPGLRPSFGHRLAHCGGSPAGRGYWLEPITEEAA